MSSQSTAVLCKNCLKEVGQEEICPNCFASQYSCQTLFTVEKKPEEWNAHAPPPMSLGTAIDLKSIRFRPSSSLTRLLTRMRGVIATFLVTALLSMIGLYGYVSHVRNQIETTDSQAQRAFQQGKYQLAQSQWYDSFLSQRKIYDTSGQSESLRNISRCLFKAEKYQLAIKELRKASVIYPSAETTELLMEYQRAYGTQLLAQSETELGEKLFQDAFRTSRQALEELKKGESPPGQIAAAQRTAAKALAYLNDFDQAQTMLAAAMKSEGESKLNRHTKTLIQKRQLAFQANRKALSNKKLNKWKPPAYAQSQRPSPRVQQQEAPSVTYYGYRPNDYSSAPQYTYPRYQPPEISEPPGGFNTYGGNTNFPMNHPVVPDPYRGQTRYQPTFPGGYQPNSYNAPGAQSLPPPIYSQPGGFQRSGRGF